MSRRAYFCSSVNVDALPNRTTYANNPLRHNVICIFHQLYLRNSCSFCHRVYLHASFDIHFKHRLLLFSYTALTNGLSAGGYNCYRRIWILIFYEEIFALGDVFWIIFNYVLYPHIWLATWRRTLVEKLIVFHYCFDKSLCRIASITN